MWDVMTMSAVCRAQEIYNVNIKYLFGSNDHRLDKIVANDLQDHRLKIQNTVPFTDTIETKIQYPSYQTFTILFVRFHFESVRIGRDHAMEIKCISLQNVFRFVKNARTLLMRMQRIYKSHTRYIRIYV